MTKYWGGWGKKKVEANTCTLINLTFSSNISKMLEDEKMDEI
jgi:hypothetical protein